MTEQVLTANRLRDGRVVYRDDSGAWRERLAEAKVFSEPEAARAELAAAKGDGLLVCGPYLFPVGRDGEGELLLSARERIRAAGPSAVIALYAEPRRAPQELEDTAASRPAPSLPARRPASRSSATSTEAPRVRL